MPGSTGLLRRGRERGVGGLASCKGAEAAWTVEDARCKLANADFLRKASAEVVQKECGRLAENEAQLENVEATLVALG